LIKVIQVELKELKCPASVLTFCRTTELPTVLKALMLMHTTEMDKNIFVTDAQAGSFKLITSIKDTIGFLKHLGLLNKAVSVHFKHQTTAQLSLTEAIRHVEVFHSYLQEANKCVL
ncbi:unnamed protein product, partial [Porites lobata]